MRVQASGAGAPVSVRQSTAASSQIRWPWFLPDGKHYVYLVAAPAANTGIYVGSLDSADTHRLGDGTSNAAYAAGYLLFVRSTTLVAQRLDLKRFRLTGEPMTVAEGVRGGGVNALFQFAVSSSGVISFRAGGTAVSQLAWLDRSGHQIATVGPPGDYLNPELSPDGKRVAFERGGTQGDRDVWLLDLTREVFTRFTLDPATDQMPVWSPDGSRIAFGSNRTGRFVELYQKLANGAGKEEVLFQSDNDKTVYDWSRDGRFIVFRRFESAGYANIWLLPMFGERKAVPFSPSPFVQSVGRVSPDGRWIAYQSNESGPFQIYIQSFPSAAGGKWQVSAGGGVYPRWSRDGRELFYLAADGQLMAVPVRITGARSDLVPDLGTPKPLFDARLVGGSSTAVGFRAQYDVAPDGQRFLVNLETGSSDSPITVVVNWQSGLAARETR